MSVGYTTGRNNWIARIAWGLLLLVAGAALATWGLSRWEAGARFLGVAPEAAVVAAPKATPQAVIAPPSQVVASGDSQRIAALEGRLAAIESQAQAAAGSAGRADAMLVAFAARRAIDRGVALGYLEPLIVQRFGAQHQRAVATIVTASRDPVRLDQLVNQYQALEPQLRGGAPDEGWWDAFQRELGSVVSIHRASVPSPQPQARYDRALASLKGGEVDRALAETMRLPGAANAADWVGNARRYIAAHRALDEVESAALLGSGQSAPAAAPTAPPAA